MSLSVLATPELLMTMARYPRPRGLRRCGVGLLAAIRICPLPAKKKTTWRSQGAPNAEYFVSDAAGTGDGLMPQIGRFCVLGATARRSRRSLTPSTVGA